MAYPSSKLDAAKNPQTRCSNCQTVFEVSRELLSSSDTRVRCGECLSIFDALEELRSAEQIDQEDSLAASEASKAAAARASTASLDVTYSDFDLFSEEADLPEIAYFDQTRDTPDFDFDAVEMGNDETFSDTLFVHDVTIDADATTLRAKPLASESKPSTEYAEIDFVADEQPREPLIFNYQDGEKAPETSESLAVPSAVPSVAATPAKLTIDEQDQQSELNAPSQSSPWFFRIGMLLLLAVLLGALYSYRTRPQLYNSATMRPVLEVGCKIMRCTLPARVDLTALKMVRKNVYSHPSKPNALVISVSFRNEAEFAQQLPVLQMVLTNRVGRTVDKQNFNPPEYMPGWTEGAIIDANQQLDVKLEVDDPGRDAQSFEFYFREYKT